MRRLAASASLAIALLLCPRSDIRGQNTAVCPSGTESSQSQLVVLGTGTPNMTASRSGTSLGILVRGTMYLFDAGPGVERRILEACDRLHIRLARFGPVFITHLHSDHTLGLPSLLYYGRNPHQPFRLFGPPGLSAMMTHVVAAFSEDRDIRLRGGHGDSTRWITDVVERTSGVVFRDSNVVVSAFAVSHGDWTHALGYRIETPDRVIVISGDTQPSDAVVKACAGCDVLVHEVYNRENDYGAAYHTTPAQLAGVAARAAPKSLILYHAVLFGASPQDILRIIGTQFHGPATMARDLDIF